MRWAAIVEASSCGQLMGLLGKIPRARWREQGPAGLTLLHYACVGNNVAAVVALILHSGLDVNARTEAGWQPVHYAADRMQPRVLEVLCAAGADLAAVDEDGVTPLAVSLVNRGDECMRVLVANGVRLRAVPHDYRPLVPPKLEAFERGVLRCRAAVVAVLRVGWSADLSLCVGRHVWATRTAQDWQPG